MERAIGCLNKTPELPVITYEGLFVFLSRVKKGEHCKILPLHEGIRHTSNYVLPDVTKFMPERWKLDSSR